MKGGLNVLTTIDIIMNAIITAIMIVMSIAGKVFSEIYMRCRTICCGSFFWFDNYFILFNLFAVEDRVMFNLKEACTLLKS